MGRHYATTRTLPKCGKATPLTKQPVVSRYYFAVRRVFGDKAEGAIMIFNYANQYVVCMNLNSLIGPCVLLGNFSGPIGAVVVNDNVLPV
jgi:hypothetical protein